MICDLMTLPDQDNPNREIYNTAYSGGEMSLFSPVMLTYDREMSDSVWNSCGATAPARSCWTCAAAPALTSASSGGRVLPGRGGGLQPQDTGGL